MLAGRRSAQWMGRAVTAKSREGDQGDDQVPPAPGRSSSANRLVSIRIAGLRAAAPFRFPWDASLRLVATAEPAGPGDPAIAGSFTP